MNFPYLYTDMSLKHVIILSIISLSTLAAHALTLNDTIRFDDGALYIGETADSLLNGSGKMIYADSTIYEGEWKNGLWDGKGKLVFPDGDSYTGDFREHEFCGYGVYRYADGGRYEGYWERGMFNGAGTMEYADGSIYSGEWKNDRKEGLGVLYQASTDRLIKGYFRNDYYYSTIEQGYDNTDWQPQNQTAPASPDTEEPDDGKFRYNRNSYNTCIGVSYGLGSMFTLHMDHHPSQWFFAGFQLGINPLKYGVGEQSVMYTYDEEGNQITTLVGWDWYMNEVLTERTYPRFKLSGEIGAGWRRLSLGTALGVATVQTVRNCRSKEENDSYFEPGTLYFREKTTGAKFAYDVFAEYVLHMRHMPLTDYISVRAGYSNIDSFNVGFGIVF